MISLGWFIIITVIVIAIQSGIYNRWGLSRVKYTRHFNKEAAFEGEFVELVEKIHNKKLLPIPWLRIESRMDSGLKFQSQANLDIKHEQYHKSLFTLMPYTGITRRHRVKCKKRGIYKLSSAALTCGELFGTQELTKVFTFNTELIVYPKILPIDEIPLPSHSWQGDITVRRWIMDDPFIISGVREYEYGDPLNKINWKSTARVGSLQVHNNDFTAQPNILIYLSMDITEDMWDAVTDTERIEKGIRYAASIANYALSKNMNVGFGSNGYIKGEQDRPVRIYPASGKQHLMYILEMMARLEIARYSTFYTFLEADIQAGVTGNDILILTCFMSDKLRKQARQLQEMGNSVEIMRLTQKGNLEEIQI